jgi:hypothetical protein
VNARFLFPVGSWSGVCAAVFFTERDARNFINAELPHRNLYEGVPNYDRRERGYRYEPERADLTPKELPNGGYMVAA